MRAGTKPGQVNPLMRLTGSVEVLKMSTTSSIHSPQNRLNRNVSLAHRVVLKEQMSTPSSLECFSSAVLNLFTLQNRSVLTAKQDSNQSC